FALDLGAADGARGTRVARVGATFIGARARLGARTGLLAGLLAGPGLLTCVRGIALVELAGREGFEAFGLGGGAA
ncbi:hypothetical protein, partial [Streptomyces sp. AC495_CC817]|uniref:hypothetical protein n=1 Tax=Streptomyces sp. AC495_CC817 TaxID=2823900 RepID=UPI001C255FA2